MCITAPQVAPKLMECIAYKSAYKTVKDTLAGQGRRPDAGQDPPAGSGETALTAQQWRQVAEQLLREDSSAADRDLSMATLMTACIIRSDDARLLRLSDFRSPSLLINVGELPVHELLIACCAFH